MSLIFRLKLPKSSINAKKNLLALSKVYIQLSTISCTTNNSRSANVQALYDSLVCMHFMGKWTILPSEIKFLIQSDRQSYLFLCVCVLPTQTLLMYVSYLSFSEPSPPGLEPNVLKKLG